MGNVGINLNVSIILPFEGGRIELLTKSVYDKPLVQDLDVIRENIVREISVHITQHCNLRCKGCYANVSKEEFAKQLSVADLEWIDKNFNPEKTVLLGGEPLLYPYLEDALKIFKHVTISTNGFYVRDKIDLLKQHKVNLQISIEGRQPYTDKIRGKGVYDKAIDAGIFAKENGIKCYFRMGYCNKNLEDVEWLLENVSTKYDIPLALLPRTDEPPMDIGRQIYLFDLIMDANNDSLVDMPHFFQYLGKRGRCHAGSERLNFTYDKAITPCHLDWQYILGYIGQPRNIINRNRKHFIQSSKYIKNECIMCPRANICKGGCRVTNAHLGCPLLANYSINSYASDKENLDAKGLVTKIDRLVSIVKDAEIC